MTAVIDDTVVKTVTANRGTVTLSRTEDGYAIRGESSTHRVGDEPQVFTAAITLCDCRTNPDSSRRRRSKSHTSACGCDNQRYSSETCVCHDNLGTRPLCPLPPRHNAQCHHTKDHCSRVEKLFDAVVKSYR